MSLKQKYTWAAFLKENPELAKKGIKRTSEEGKKAFDKAYKSFTKDFLSKQESQIAKFQSTNLAKKEVFVSKLKALDNKKERIKAKNLNQKIGRLDSAAAGWDKQLKRVQEIAKQV